MAFVGSTSISLTHRHTRTVAARGRWRCATETPKLSPRALELVKKQGDRPIFDYGKFGGVWEQAEAEKRFLTDEELESSSDDTAKQAAKIVRDNVEELVQKARAQLLEKFPDITVSCTFLSLDRKGTLTILLW